MLHFSPPLSTISLQDSIYTWIHLQILLIYLSISIPVSNHFHQTASRKVFTSRSTISTMLFFFTNFLAHFMCLFFYINVRMILLSAKVKYLWDSNWHYIDVYIILGRLDILENDVFQFNQICFMVLTIFSEVLFIKSYFSC